MASANAMAPLRPAGTGEEDLVTRPNVCPRMHCCHLGLMAGPHMLSHLERRNLRAYGFLLLDFFFFLQNVHNVRRTLHYFVWPIPGQQHALIAKIVLLGT